MCEPITEDTVTCCWCWLRAIYFHHWKHSTTEHPLDLPHPLLKDICWALVSLLQKEHDYRPLCARFLGHPGKDEFCIQTWKTVCRWTDMYTCAPLGHNKYFQSVCRNYNSTSQKQGSIILQYVVVSHWTFTCLLCIKKWYFGPSVMVQALRRLR